MSDLHELVFRPAGPAGRPEGEPSDLDALTGSQLGGFFEGWPDPPSEDRLVDILAGSQAVELCFCGDEVVGLLCGLTDGVLSLYLPLLEVRVDQRGRGIARRLVERMLARFEGLYAVDLVCDEELVPFYEGLGLRPLRAMALRRYERQAARPEDQPTRSPDQAGPLLR